MLSQLSLLEQFFDSTLCCVALVDKNYKYIRVNKAYANLLRRSTSYFSGRDFFEITPMYFLPTLKKVISSKTTFKAESVSVHTKLPNEPTTTYWDFTLTPALDDQGEIQMLLFCFNEVSMHKYAKDQLEEALKQLRDLSNQLVNIEEQERHRIALELHDEIGQELTVIKLNLENARAKLRGIENIHLEDALTSVNETIETVRRIAFDLRPPMLDDLGLLSALLWLFGWHRTATGLEVQFKHSGLENRLPREIETTIYRICQESLTNIVRHAGVTTTDVAVWIRENSIILRVEDKGCGFDPAAVSNQTNCVGLMGMRERARLLGGDLIIDSVIGNGTTITADLSRFRSNAS